MNATRQLFRECAAMAKAELGYDPALYYAMLCIIPLLMAVATIHARWRYRKAYALLRKIDRQLDAIVASRT